MTATTGISSHDTQDSRVATLTLAALGVVYGDIGTSPLYALKEVFGGTHHPVPIEEANVLGILSVVFWALMLVVSVKYIVFIMRANNRGEGGIMALMALVLHGEKDAGRARVLMMMGLFGAALFYGDGMITPAISVLSAVEGLEVATPALKPYVIPVTLVVLVVLFLFQRHGTGRVGALFGPVMVVWFLTLSALGIVGILRAPQVLKALSPLYAFGFFTQNPALGFFSLGAVVLAVTGAEALYADMGHFGARPVRIAWAGLVAPALALNYFGQGALLIVEPAAVENPFYKLAPGWALYPLVALSTFATIIASQAVISGAFSITQQAMQLGYAPRMEVRHTSSREIGQVFLPIVNRTLFVGVVVLVLGFGSSTNLAAAYGIAVTGTMAITTVLAFVVARRSWGWALPACVALFGAFLLIDLAFFAANALKIVEGGWFPIAFALVAFLFMSTWKRGRAILHARLEADSIPVPVFVASASLGCATVPGTAVFMTSNPSAVPHALLHSMKHYKSLHERIALLTVITLDVPHVPVSQRVAVEPINGQFCRVKVFFGFMDKPNLPEALDWAAEQGLRIDMMDTSFFLGRETLLPKIGSDMALWREKLFVAMYKNSGSVAAYFGLPPNRIVELGSQVEL
ncbi:MAG TPA: potassium transporter Kup [Burkholderiaceae bacterium]|nr:potassium transporter Kup [Burkholderiaceae bacterium]